MMTHGRIVAYKEQLREAFDGYTDALGRIERGEADTQESMLLILTQLARVAFIVTPALLDEMDDRLRQKNR